MDSAGNPCASRDAWSWDPPEKKTDNAELLAEKSKKRKAKRHCFIKLNLKKKKKKRSSRGGKKTRLRRELRKLATAGSVEQTQLLHVDQNRSQHFQDSSHAYRNVFAQEKTDVLSGNPLLQPYSIGGRSTRILPPPSFTGLFRRRTARRSV